MTAEDRAAHVEREAVANMALSVWSNTCNAYCDEQDRVHSPECVLSAALYTRLDQRRRAADAVLAALPEAGDVAAVVVRVEALADKWDLIADANEAARGVKTKVAGYYRRHATTSAPPSPPGPTSDRADPNR